MGWARWWAGELTCNELLTGRPSAVACAAKESTTCQICIPLVGLRQRRRLAVHLLLEQLEGARAGGVPQVDMRESDRKSQIFATYTCHESERIFFARKSSSKASRDQTSRSSDRMVSQLAISYFFRSSP